MRGKLVDIVVWVVGLRITPAGAGKTAASVCRAFCFQDHPRRCGENSRVQIIAHSTRGSPPQVRGKLYVLIRGLPLPRITPAGAGKTTRGAAKRLTAKDHPRRCGENRCRCLRLQHINGSPPQVRGKRGIHCIIPNSNGITPAGAGKTKNLALVKLDSWDHPRRCGENLLLPLRGPSSVGSPPQVRGKRHLIILNFLYFGITPAGAGKTIVRFAYMGRGQDHPRRCGENNGNIASRFIFRGSPPQVRGKHSMFRRQR